MKKYFSKIVACVLSATLVISPFANVAYGDDTVTNGVTSGDILTTEDIPDAYLYANLLDCVDQNGDSLIQISEAEEASWLDISGPVRDFTGLEYFANSNSINCCYDIYNEDGEEDKEAEKKSLQSFVSKIADFENLTTLNLYVDGVDSEIMRGISGLAITEMDLKIMDDGQWLCDTALVGTPLYNSMENLYLSIDGDEDFSFNSIKNFINLSELTTYCYENAVTDFDVLNDMKLISLSIDSEITQEEIDKLALTELKEVLLINRYVLNVYDSSEIEKPSLNIEQFSKATSLDINGFKVEGDLEKLSEELGYLILDNCELPCSELDLSKYTEIYSLYIEYCGLNSIIGLENMNSLGYLSLIGNNLTTIPTLPTNGEEQIWIYGMDLSENNITNIDSLVKLDYLKDSLGTLYLDSNNISTLPDMSGFKNLSILDLSDNKIESLAGVNLDKLEKLSFTNDGFGYYSSFSLGGNLLDKEDVVGYVPQKFSADIDWLMEATSRRMYDGALVYSKIDSELIASKLEEVVDSDSTSVGFNISTICKEVILEEELLDYVRELGIDLHILLEYYDEATKRYESSTYVEFSEYDESVSTVTLNLDVVDRQKASDEICQLLNNDIVYSSVDIMVDVADYVRYDFGSSYNIYTIVNGKVERVERDEYLEQICNYIDGGRYPQTGYYYVYGPEDKYYYYTDVEGENCDPEKYVGVQNDSSEVATMIEKASKGEVISVAISDNNMQMSVEAWNAIIEKELTLKVKIIDNCSIVSIYTINKNCFDKIEQGEYASFGIDISETKETIGISSTFITQEKENDYSYIWVSDIEEYNIPVSIHVGYVFANKTSVMETIGGRYILDANMEKVWKYYDGSSNYTVEKGMVTFTSKGDYVLLVNAKANSDVSENKPNFDANKTYKDGDLLVEVAGQKNANVNIEAVKDGFTIVSEFELTEESEVLETYTSPIFALDDRKENFVDSFITADGGMWLDVQYMGDKYEEYRSAFLGNLKPGNHEVIINVYKQNNEVMFDAYVDGLKSVSTRRIDIDWSKLYTLYGNDEDIRSDRFSLVGPANVKSNKIYAGVILPDEITEKEVIESVKGLPEKFIVKDAYENTGALVLKSGDKYEITFDFKSEQEDLGQFVFKIVEEIGYEFDYDGYASLIAMVEALGYYDWGEGIGYENGEKAIKCTVTGYDTEAEIEAAISKLKEGTSATVTIERNGDNINYVSNIAGVKVVMEVVAPETLPEELYLVLALYEGEMTNIKTYRNGELQEAGAPVENDKPEVEDPKEEPKEDPKEEPKEEPKEDPKEDPKEEESVVQKPIENTNEAGKNSAPETIKEEKIVEPAKVLETAAQKMKETILKTVEVVSTKAQTLTKEVFETIQSEGKNLTVGVADENNQLQYSWTFSNRAINNTDMNIDLTITFDDEKKEEISEITGRKDALYISFAHHGELPGPATIKTYVGDKYKNGDVVYLYYYSEEAKKILMVGNKPLTVKGGYVEYTITHCSTYFLMEEKLANVEKDEKSLDDATVNVTNDAIPGLGDTTKVVVWYVVLTLALCIVVATNKNRHAEN